MKKSITILNVMLVLFISANAISQEVKISEEEIWLDQLVKEYSYNVVLQNNLTNNQAFIIQEGSENDVMINQTLTNRYDKNLINMLQQGLYNRGYINQVGAGLEHNVYQYGNKNLMDMESRGKSVKSTLFQVGDDNKVQQRLAGEDMNYVILQEGSRLELIHRENGKSFPEYRIEQRGVGMKVIVEHSNVYRK